MLSLRSAAIWPEFNNKFRPESPKSLRKKSEKHLIQPLAQSARPRWAAPGARRVACRASIVSKARTAYVCADCGAHSVKWAGQCPDCGAWNTLAETRPLRRPHRARFGGDPGCGAAGRPRQLRHSSGFAELDRVLGGGLVPGAVVLLGGDPGVGKSTLLQQASAALSRDLPVLLCERRGVVAPGRPAGLAPRSRCRVHAPDGRDLTRCRARGSHALQGACRRHRLHPDDDGRVTGFGAGLGCTVARGGRSAGAVRQAK